MLLAGVLPQARPRRLDQLLSPQQQLQQPRRQQQPQLRQPARQRPPQPATTKMVARATRPATTRTSACPTTRPQQQFNNDRNDLPNSYSITVSLNGSLT